MDALPTPDQLNLGLLLLRVLIGPVFAFHGYAKIFRGGRLAGTAGWFESMGMKPSGWIHARVAAGGEIATGTCLALGLLTPFAGLGMVGLMSVAFWTVHKGNGLLIVKEGWEYVLVLGTLGAAIGLVGPGQWSLDNALGLDLNGPAGLAISLGGGLAAAALLLATCYRPPAPEPADEAAAA